MRFVVQLDGQTLTVEVEGRGDRFLVTIDGDQFQVDARAPRPGALSLLIDGASYLADVRDDDGHILVEIAGETYRLRVEEELRARLRGQLASTGPRGARVVSAPMPGKVVTLLVGVGDQVAVGSGLIVIEAMKMENELRSTISGEVREIRVAVGEAVIAGQILLVIE